MSERVPSRQQLQGALTRTAVGVVLLAGAALVVRTGGIHAQVAPYALMAAACVPQLLLCALAVADDDRRGKLRVSRRPMPLLGAVALVLVAAALAGVSDRGPLAGTLAAALAAIGCAVAAIPPVVAAVPRKPSSGGWRGRLGRLI
ncbi:MAG TPA: hypothetical protein VFS29_09345 [Motilibacteraceae bacterium]|nr:hypothetical protein [Motilibacteraceae bacterium]